jgi:TRAP-type C4-dicarboxylate transport system substrate-binding protein
MQKRAKRVFSFVICLIMIATLAACGSSTQESSTEASATPGSQTTMPEESTAAQDTQDDQSDWVTLNLKYACYLPDGNPTNTTFTLLQEKLDEYMPGKITIDMYCGGTLYGQSDTYDGVLSGGCDIGYIDLGTVATRFPLTQIFVYPGIGFNSSKVAAQVMLDWINTTQPAEYQDTVLLGTQASGPLTLCSTRKVTTLADMQGLQVRSGNVLARTIEAWGGTPVTMDTSEVYEGLRSGLIDGYFSFFSACSILNLDEIVDYNLITNLSSQSFIYVMNKDTFNKMPESQQEVFQQAVMDVWEEYTCVYVEQLYQSDERCIEYYNNTETTFLDPGTPEYEEFKAAGEKLMDGYIAQLDEQGLDGTGNLEVIRELADKYNQETSWEEYKSYFDHS